MPIFLYSAAERSGKVVKGEREAENEKALAQTLKGEGFFLLDVKGKGAGGNGVLGMRFSFRDILDRLKPVGLVEKIFFTRNLSVMVGAGLSLTRALEALADETSNTKFKKIVNDLNSTIVQGKSFADALRLHEKVFGRLFISMVEVGEATGKLTLVLKILARQMKKDRDLRKRVKGAMMYPAIILIALGGVGTLMMIYVIPTLVDTVKELNVPLPLTTKIVIATSDIMTAFGLWIFLAFIACIIAFWRILKTNAGKTAFDRMVLWVPIFGTLIQKFNIARFCRILSYLITSGVPIVHGLEITSSVLGNTLFRNATQEAGVEIQKGKALREILSAHIRLFPPVVLQMVGVGEETGKISSMLLRLAIFFEEDVSNTTKNLSTIIEPILMVIIGVVVGFFAVSMLQPIYSSLGNI